MHKLEQLWTDFLLILLMLIFLCILLAPICAPGGEWRAARPTQSWEWSDPASYHWAACRVTAADGSSGTGAYVQHGKAIGVLTAAHVVRGSESATCRFLDGTNQSGLSTYCKLGHDVGFVFVKHPTIKPLVVSAIPPRTGDRVEFLSMGGPKGKLRPFWATVQADGRYDCYVIAGDSGSAILSEGHAVVGVQTCGHSGSLRSDWGVYRGSSGATYVAVKAFLQRVERKHFSTEYG